MLYSVDYFLNTKSISSFLLMHKFHCFKDSVSTKIERINLYFFLKDIITLEDARIYNYFYFFKFFLGITAFFSGYKSFFDRGKTTFDIKIQALATKSNIYKVLLFFSNDVLSLLDTSYLSFSITQKNKHFFVANYVLKDMNLFTEKKTNVGLFNLQDVLVMKINIIAISITSIKCLLQSFKILF